jgi:NAD(P)-dependent dehydrogenase (short-subunit alcohol dehydrogenase family)
MNLTTTFLMSREALRIMKKEGRGSIISIAAKTGLAPEAGRASYAVAKRGIITLTETMAAEVQGMEITVNAIAPAQLSLGGVLGTTWARIWRLPEAPLLPLAQIV